MQAKYEITSHTISSGNSAAIFGVSYKNSNGNFEGQEATPGPPAGYPYYNIIIGQDIAPMGPQGYTGSTGPTGMAGPNVILASSVWLAGDHPATWASLPVAEEFITYDAASAYTKYPTEVSGMYLNLKSCDPTPFSPGDFKPEKLKDKKLVIRGYDSSCADPNVYLMQALYTIKSSVSGNGAGYNWVDLSLNYQSSAGQFGEAMYHQIIIGEDIAPMGPTGPCCTGPTGYTGPKGVDGVGANGVWRLNELNSEATEAWAEGEFSLLNTANIPWKDTDTFTGMDVSFVCMTLQNCDDISNTHLETSGNTVGAYLIIRGWDETCAGDLIFETQWKYMITGHDLVHHGAPWPGGMTNPLVKLDVVPHGGYGVFGPSQSYHHIIIGADPAPPGPTGPTGPPGPTGNTGPKGVDGVGANGVWRLNELNSEATEAWAEGEFSLLNTANIPWKDTDTFTGMDVSFVCMTLQNCDDISNTHLETSGNTVGAYLIIRGWDETCAGDLIFETQWKYMITGHDLVHHGAPWPGGMTNPLVKLSVVPHDGYGVFGPSQSYHHIIIGADPAPPGPTGPTGPTGPQGIQGFTGGARHWRCGCLGIQGIVGRPSPRAVERESARVDGREWHLCQPERRPHGTSRRCECNICKFYRLHILLP